MSLSRITEIEQLQHCPNLQHCVHIFFGYAFQNDMIKLAVIKIASTLDKPVQNRILLKKTQILCVWHMTI